MADDLDGVIESTGMARRTFMRRLVTGAVFAMPVVASFAMAAMEAASALLTTAIPGRLWAARTKPSDRQPEPAVRPPVAVRQPEPDRAVRAARRLATIRPRSLRCGALPQGPGSRH